MGKYKNPSLTADIFIFDDDENFILIKRGNEPYKNHWALPGGFVEYGECVEDAAIREAFEEIWDEKNYSPITDTPLLTTGELCKRWNITPDTLHNWEKQGKIAKLPLGGRKKMYSLKDVEEAEVSGIVISKAS